MTQLMEKQRAARAAALNKQLECGCPPDSTGGDGKPCPAGPGGGHGTGGRGGGAKVQATKSEAHTTSGNGGGGGRAPSSRQRGGRGAAGGGGLMMGRMRQDNGQVRSVLHTNSIKCLHFSKSIILSSAISFR